MNRWQFQTRLGDVAYQFEKNPKTMTTPGRQHSTTTTSVSIDGRRRALRTADVLGDWSFQGRIRNQDEYDAFVTWSNQPDRIRILDHYNRLHEVFVVGFEPVAVQKSGRPLPWLFDYTFKTLYIRRIS